MRLFPLPGNESAAAALASRLGAETGRSEIRRFPDGEWYARIDERLDGEPCAIVATLDRPDTKLLPLLFTARLLRERGARRVGLVAPYLCYLRQDRRFRAGEAVTSRDFASILGAEIDWLVTVDPHLHRYRSLDEIYGVPSRIAEAAEPIAEWLRPRIARPFLIGPDAESEPWTARVAKRIGAPYAVLDKERHGDHTVSVVARGLEGIEDRTPVVIDDVISTGRTLVAVIELLRERGASAPVCIAVHGIFAEGAEDDLRAAGAAALVTTNTITGPTGEIDVSRSLAEAVRLIEASAPTDRATGEDS